MLVASPGVYSSSDMYKQRTTEKGSKVKSKLPMCHITQPCNALGNTCMYAYADECAMLLYIWCTHHVCWCRVQPKVILMPKTFHTAHCFLWLSEKSVTSPTPMVCWLRYIHPLYVVTKETVPLPSHQVWRTCGRLCTRAGGEAVQTSTYLEAGEPP